MAGEIRTITVSMENGKLQCKPRSMGANPGDTIIWDGTIPFAIHFLQHSPLTHFAPTSLGTGGVHSVQKEVVYDHTVGGPKCFEYVIAAFDKEANRGEKFGIIDPEIIIPRGSGGRP